MPQQGESVETKERSDNGSDNENEDEESSWGDWDGDGVVVMCLLCDWSNQDFSLVLKHMKDEHNFDFEMFTRDLNFYEKVSRR